MNGDHFKPFTQMRPLDGDPAERVLRKGPPRRMVPEGENARNRLPGPKQARQPKLRLDDRPRWR